ncbi:MAG TPA: hypothetical protein VGK64_09985 [Bryobacteraceae bacterium]
MLPSIGNAPAPRPAREEMLTRAKSGRGNASGNDTPAKDEGFDQVFASAAKADDGRSDTATHEGQSHPVPKSKAQSNVESGSPRPPAPVAVNKQPGLMQATAELLGAQTADGEAAGSPDEPATAPLVSALAILAGRGEGSKQEKVPIAGAKRQEESEKPATDPLTVLGGMPNGAPLDPSSVAVLLGTGTARPANPVMEPGMAATSAESSVEKEMPLISGVAPKQQPSANAAGGELAFALRLSREASPAAQTDAPIEAVGAGASVNTFVKELETAVDKTAGEIKTRIGNESAAAGAANIVETRTPAPAAHEAAQATPAATPVSKAEAPELPTMSSAPVRAVRVELASDGNQRVALTLVERGGALSVSVHSADSHLARSLQEHLPDLSTRLGEQRYQTEIWTPRVEAPDAAGAGESAHHDSESGGGMQGGADRNPNPGEQQGRGNREAPKWFEELAAIGRRPPTRSEYLWVQ